MKKVIFMWVITVFLIGCNNAMLNDLPEVDYPEVNCPEKTQPPASRNPGQFSATVLGGNMGISRARAVAHTANASMGTFTIPNSRSIHFILRNVGDFPITNVTLTAGKLNLDGEAFEPITGNGIAVSPSAIAMLEPSYRANVETVIAVDINHGNIIGLISQQHVHSADFAGTTIRVEGTTTDGEGEVLDVSIDVNIETLIQVASFELHYSYDSGETFRRAGVTTDGIFRLPRAYMEYILFLNTGNVPIRFQVNPSGGGQFDGEYAHEWITINSGGHANFPIPTNMIDFDFLVDTIGVVFDIEQREQFGFRPNTSFITMLPNHSNLFVSWIF